MINLHSKKNLKQSVCKLNHKLYNHLILDTFVNNKQGDDDTSTNEDEDEGDYEDEDKDEDEDDEYEIEDKDEKKVKISECT